LSAKEEYRGWSRGGGNFRVVFQEAVGLKVGW
jgi:hypothetical protein